MSDATPPVPTPLANMGQPIQRYEAVGKVTGAPIYADDIPVGKPLYAYFLTSGIAKGTITAIDTSVAEALPGVVKVYTHHNPPAREKVGYFQDGGYVSDSNMPLTGPDIHNDGQIVAMVLAEDLATARDASHRIAVRYAAQHPSATFDSPGATTAHPDPLTKKEKKAGHFDRAFADAPVKIDARYSTPTMHHNPIELFSTSAVWHGDRLLIHEPTQFTYQLANGAAAVMGVDVSKVRVLDPFIGGAFGSKGTMTQRTGLITSAARELKRPVKNVVMRDQGFTLATYRAETRHHIRMGATKNGKLVAFGHEGWETTSRQDDYSVAGIEATTEMYAAPNIWSRGQPRPCRSQHAGLYALAAGNAVHVRARGGDGRDGGRARDGSDRVPPDQRHAGEPGQRCALYQPIADEMF